MPEQRKEGKVGDCWSAIWPKKESVRGKARRLMCGHGYSRLLPEFSGVIRSSRRTESRDVMGNGKVGLGARAKGLYSAQPMSRP